MSLAEQFPEIMKRNQPLAPFTHLKIGGPAEFLVQPRATRPNSMRFSPRACAATAVPVRMLGGGFNLLVQDDPILGAVILLTAASFTVPGRRGQASRRGRRRPTLRPDRVRGAARWADWKRSRGHSRHRRRQRPLQRRGPHRRRSARTVRNASPCHDRCGEGAGARARRTHLQRAPERFGRAGDSVRRVRTGRGITEARSSNGCRQGVDPCCAPRSR